MNSLTYRLFTKIKPGCLRHSAHFCCKDAATGFSYIFEKKNFHEQTLGPFSCLADKQNCKCYLPGVRRCTFQVQRATWTQGSLRQDGCSSSCRRCINTDKCDRVTTCDHDWNRMQLLCTPQASPMLPLLQCALSYEVTMAFTAACLHRLPSQERREMQD